MNFSFAKTGRRGGRENSLQLTCTLPLTLSLASTLKWIKKKCAKVTSREFIFHRSANWIILFANFR
jgi:hypothetical protein